MQPVIPTLALADLSSGEQQNVLVEALRGDGVFYLTDPGFDRALVGTLIAESRAVFDRSGNESLVCSELPLRGLTPFRGENLGQFLNVGDVPDLCWKYSWCGQHDVSPNEVFRHAYQTHFEAMDDIAQCLMRVIARELTDETSGTKDDWNLMVHGTQTLRHLYYPDCDIPQELAMVPHSDLGTITLLYQTPSPNNHVALEVEINGNFVPVPARQDAMAVLVGDTLQHVTEGRVRAARHRVVHSGAPGSERTSTISFFLPQDQLNLSRFGGSTFSGLFDESTPTFGDVLKKDGQEYLKKL